MDAKSQESGDKITRRDFIRIGAAGAAMVGAGGSACSKAEKAEKPVGEAVVPKKKLGKTQMFASTLAMGGGSALSMVKNDDDALALIDLARSKGVNYFDTGSSYGEGKSEERFGMALSPYRKEIYLSTKYNPGDEPDKLMKKFETSLKRFQTDYVDIANMHGLSVLEDTELMFSSGALETLVKLKEQGVVKNIGFTSHAPPPAVEAMKRFRFDVVCFATSAARIHWVEEFQTPQGSFEDEAIALANEQGVGLWAFKVTGQRRLIQRQDEPNKAPGSELIRYGFSLPVHGVILGMSTPEHVTSACEMSAGFTPMTEEEMHYWNERLSPSATAATLDYLRPGYVDDGGPRAHLA